MSDRFAWSVVVVGIVAIGALGIGGGIAHGNYRYAEGWCAGAGGTHIAEGWCDIDGRAVEVPER